MPALILLHMKKKLLKIDALDHPQYSSKLSPSDFHLFRPLTTCSKGNRFANNGAVKEGFRDWIRIQTILS
jgi:hypothetical protein